MYGDVNSNQGFENFIFLCGIKSILKVAYKYKYAMRESQNETFNMLSLMPPKDTKLYVINNTSFQIYCHKMKF